MFFAVHGVRCWHLKAMTENRLTVYYDGECHLCSREIEHYRKKDTAHRLRLIDISDPHFTAAAAGLDSKAVRRELHVRLPSGELAVGLPAFVAIWDALPGFGPLAKLARLPVINPLLRGGYQLFAAVRPYLPKRQREECVDGKCAI